MTVPHPTTVPHSLLPTFSLLTPGADTLPEVRIWLGTAVSTHLLQEASSP